MAFYVTWETNQHENIYKTKPYATFTTSFRYSINVGQTELHREWTGCEYLI